MNGEKIRKNLPVIKTIKTRLRIYWDLIKSPQTALLLLTGLAGYISAGITGISGGYIMGIAGSLFLAISGSTILNMYFDRDIDSQMPRTCWRPLPTGKISPREALLLGLVFSIIGIAWAAAIDWLFASIIFAGVFFNVVVYTLWLKRRTAWSIVWGGLAGGMPVLAGRSLALGHIDIIGLLLAAAILFWIPTHILTFNMRYFDDYNKASLPTFASVYGFQTTRVIIAISSIAAALVMIIASVGIGLTAGFLRLLIVLSSGLLLLALTSMFRPSERLNMGVFKYASLYMFGSMLMIIIEKL